MQPPHHPTNDEYDNTKRTTTTERAVQPLSLSLTHTHLSLQLVLHKQHNTLFLSLTHTTHNNTQHTMPPHIWVPGGSAGTALKHLGGNTRRREALSLYREILRTCKAFHWCDEYGEPWNARLRREARKEFDQSKEETDPLIVARMLVTGRDCVQQVQNRFNEADRAAWKRIEEERQR